MAMRSLFSGGDDSGDDGGGHGDDQSHGDTKDFGLSVVLVALVFGLAAKALPEWGKESTATSTGSPSVFDPRFLPYTVLILVFGLVVGIIDQTNKGNYMRDGIHAWMYVDPHVVLFTFLPVLLFQSAFSAEVHILMHEMKQIVLLAVPGVLSSTALTGCFVHFCYPEWEWNLCMLLGAILSATDPVAVVAMLKELGVDERLATLIEGESLLNDGTAIVVYTLFSKALFHSFCCSGTDVIHWAVRLSFGGPIVGLAVGYGVIMLLEGRVSNDLNSEVTLTVVACYACFMIAEGTRLHVSGVLAVVVCGLFVASRGQGKFNVKVEKNLEAFWQIAEYVANTVIFFVSGLIMARVLLPASITGATNAITAADWGILIALYFAVHLIRAFNIGLFWRWMTVDSLYGKDWDHKQGSILVMGGLRGAVGLALALVTEHELQGSDLPHHNKKSSRVLFHVAGIAFLTLLINGTFMPWIIQHYGLDKVSTADEELFHHSCAIVEARLEKHVEELKEDLFLGNADFQQVWRYIPIFSAEQYWSRLESRKVHLDANERWDAGIERADAKRMQQSSDQSYKHCPPPLQELWKHYHKKYKGTNSKFNPALLRQNSTLSSTSLTTNLAAESDKESRLENQKKKAQADLDEVSHELRKLKREKVYEATRITLKEARNKSSEISTVSSTTLGTSSASFTGEDSETHKDRLVKGRTRYLTSLRAMYITNHHSGRMRSRTLRYLLWCADMQLDEAEQPLKDWDKLEAYLEGGFHVPTKREGSISDWIEDLPLIGAAFHNFRMRLFYDQLSFIQEIANEFVYARQEIDIHELLDENEEKGTIEKEIESQKSRAFEFMRSIMQWPEISVAINTMTAARQMLMFHEKLVDELVEHGALTESEVEKLREKTAHGVEKLSRHPISEKVRDIKTVLLEGPIEYSERLPFMTDVGADEIDKLIDTEVRTHAIFTEYFVAPETYIFVKGNEKAYPGGAILENEKDEGGLEVSNTKDGRSGWFVLVRGKLRCFDEKQRPPRCLPGFDAIGIVEQICCKPMKWTYQTASWAQLIFVDKELYLKEVWKQGTASNLFNALYRTVAARQLPYLFNDERVTFGVAAMSSTSGCKFVAIKPEEEAKQKKNVSTKFSPVRRATSTPDQIPEETEETGESLPPPPAMSRQRSSSWGGLTGVGSNRRQLKLPPGGEPEVDRSRSMSNVAKFAGMMSVTPKGKRNTNFNTFNAQSPETDFAETKMSEHGESHQVADLQKGKIFILVSGEVFGRMPETREEADAALMVDGVKKLAEKASLNFQFSEVEDDEVESGASKLGSLSKINEMLDRLLDNGDAAKAPVRRALAPALIKGVQGKVRAAKGSVLLEVSSHILAAKAASKFLIKYRKNKASNAASGMAGYEHSDVSHEPRRKSIFDVISEARSKQQSADGGDEDEKSGDETGKEDDQVLQIDGIAGLLEY